MSWQKAVEELLASCPPEIREMVERQLQPLEEAQMQRDAALRALDLVVRAVYEAHRLLTEAGMVLPVDEEQFAACDREREERQRAAESEMDEAFVNTAATEALRRDVAEYQEAIKSGRLESEPDDQAFIDAAGAEVLKKTEWEE